MKERIISNEHSENLMLEHRQRYIDLIINNIKYSSTDLSLKDVQDDIDWLYDCSGLNKPRCIFLANSYLEYMLMLDFINNDNTIQTAIGNHGPPNEILNFIRNDIIANVESQVWDYLNLTDNLDKNMKTYLSESQFELSSVTLNRTLKSDLMGEIRKIIKEQTWTELLYLTRGQLERNIRNGMITQTSAQLGENSVWYHDGTFDKMIEIGNKHKWNERIDTKSWKKEEIEQKVWRQVESQIELEALDKIRFKITHSSNWDLTKRINSGQIHIYEQIIGLLWNSRMWLYDYLNTIGKIENKYFSKYSELLKKGVLTLHFDHNWVMVVQMPKKIFIDSEDRLHSINGSAIEWRGGYSSRPRNYFLHGVSFSNSKKDEQLWIDITNGNRSTTKILKQIKNMEQRQAALSVISIEKIVKDSEAELISTCFYDRKKIKDLNQFIHNHRDLQRLEFHVIKLYKIKGKKLGSIDRDVYMLLYSDPSTGREYYDYVDPLHLTKYGATADNAMSWKLGLSAEQYAAIEVET